MDQQVATKTKLILVVDDDQAVVQALGKRCEQLGIRVRKAHNAVEAMTVINQEEEPPDLMLVDYSMPGADGLTLCEMVKSNQAYQAVSFVLLTGHDNEETRRRCAQTGAHYVRKDVDAWEVLEPLIRRLIGLGGAGRPEENGFRRRASGAPKGTDRDPRSLKPEARGPRPSAAGKKILIIDDDPMIAKGLRVRLQALGYRAYEAMTGMDGYLVAAKEHPDLIILDYKMPRGWGNTVLGKLKSNPSTRDIPVIILSGMTDVGIQRDVLTLGAERWINKPFEIKDLMKIIRERIGPPRKNKA